MPLNDKQKRFVAEYLVDLNATQAAIRAGYSKKTAYSQGQRLLKHAEAARAIQEAKNARAARVGMTQDDVLRELQAIGQSDIRHYTIDDFGEMKLADDAPDRAMRAVASVKKRIRTDEHGNVVGAETEFKLWDKPAALKMAGQHLGTFVDRHEITGKDGQPLHSEITVRFVEPKERG